MKRDTRPKRDNTDQRSQIRVLMKELGSEGATATQVQAILGGSLKTIRTSMTSLTYLGFLTSNKGKPPKYYSGREVNNCAELYRVFHQWRSNG